MQYALIFHPTEKPSLTPPLSPILALTALTASLVQTKHSVLPQGHRKPGNILTLVTGLCVFCVTRTAATGWWLRAALSAIR